MDGGKKELAGKHRDKEERGKGRIVSRQVEKADKGIGEDQAKQINETKPKLKLKWLQEQTRMSVREKHIIQTRNPQSKSTHSHTNVLFNEAC